MAKKGGGTRHFASGVLSGVDVTLKTTDIEETAQVSLVRGIRRWWESAQVQRKLARLMARPYGPRAFVVTWSGRPKLAVMPFDDLLALDQLAGAGEQKVGTEQARRVAGELRRLADELEEGEI